MKEIPLFSDHIARNLQFEIWVCGSSAGEEALGCCIFEEELKIGRER
jgi:hypothetical protein